MDETQEAAPERRGTRHVRRILSAYTGEHGIYGIVLVTALIAIQVEAETDGDVILAVFGTITVFWSAHVYAHVVAGRGRRPVEPLGRAVLGGIRHSSGMGVAMLIPFAILLTGVIGLVDEATAYLLALVSGVVLLAVIGYLNAWRNGSSWPWRILGVLITTFFGLIVIVVSIAAH